MHVFIIRNHSEWQNDIGIPNGECEREKLKRENRIKKMLEAYANGLQKKSLIVSNEHILVGFSARRQMNTTFKILKQI